MTHLQSAVFVIVMDLLVGLLGFALSINWSKATERTVDRDSTIFLAKMWAVSHFLG